MAAPRRETNATSRRLLKAKQWGKGARRVLRTAHLTIMTRERRLKRHRLFRYYPNHCAINRCCEKPSLYRTRGHPTRCSFFREGNEFYLVRCLKKCKPSGNEKNKKNIEEEYFGLSTSSKFWLCSRCVFLFDVSNCTCGYRHFTSFAGSYGLSRDTARSDSNY